MLVVVTWYMLLVKVYVLVTEVIGAPTAVVVFVAATREAVPEVVPARLDASV